MIRSFKDKRTERLARNEFVKELEPIAARARQRLGALEAAMSLQDLRAVQGNRWEALKGDRAGQHSIRINDR